MAVSGRAPAMAKAAGGGYESAHPNKARRASAARRFVHPFITITNDEQHRKPPTYNVVNGQFFTKYIREYDLSRCAH